jgi:hypothetical protein
MAGFFIPGPRFEMPSLLEPRRKPVGPVVLDRSHWAAPDRLATIFDGTELVGKHSLTPTGNIPRSVHNGEIVLDTSAGGGNQFDIGNPFVKSADDPMTLVFRCQNTSASTSPGMILGDSTNTTDFIWLRQGSSIFIRNSTNNNATYGSFNDFNDELLDYAISMNGGGAGSETLYFYQAGNVSTAQTGYTLTLSINAMLNGYTGSSFKYQGFFSYFYIYDKALSTQQIKDIHANPYQMLIPA